MEWLKKNIKYVIIAVVVLVIVVFLKPAPKPKDLSSKKTSGPTGKDLFAGLKYALDGDPEKDAEIPISYKYLTKKQMEVVDKERKRAGKWGGKIDWDSYAANVWTQLGVPDEKRGPYTGVFKGLDVLPTGKGVWILKAENIFNKIADSVDGEFDSDAFAHWNIRVGQYLTEL